MHLHRLWSVAAAVLSSALFAAHARAAPVRIVVVGTNDLHGRVERTASLSGHLKNIRSPTTGVVLIDGGDLFQGTLESNLGEGSVVIEAYNALGYAAATIGNHEFDFGPQGPVTVAQSDRQDPRGALRQRAGQARFPLLAANIIDDKTGKPWTSQNVKPSTMVEVKGVKVGIVGVTTIDTPKTTIASNFKGLSMAPVLDTIVAEATALRAKGAHLIVVAAHAGGKCEDTSKPEDLSSCDADQEIFQVAKALPPGLVNAIVAGHTHAAVAHVVSGTAVIESWANGRGFGRVDFIVDTKAEDPAEVVKLEHVHPPQPLCSNDAADISACDPGEYEGKAVEIDQQLLARLNPHLKRAKAARDRKLGVTVVNAVQKSYDRESALGNLFADLMRQAQPGSDVAIMNGGGIRADLPKGDLTYGHVFEMMPFDNRFATATMTVAQLKTLLAENLSYKKGGVVSTSGVRIRVSCKAGKATVKLTNEDGGELKDDATLKVVLTDFMATGGDGVFSTLGLAPDAVVVDEGEPVREQLAALLQKKGGSLDGNDPALFDSAERRIRVDTNAVATRCAAR